MNFGACKKKDNAYRGSWEEDLSTSAGPFMPHIPTVGGVAAPLSLMGREEKQSAPTPQLEPIDDSNRPSLIY